MLDLDPLPPPTTFAEGRRLIFGWLAAGAGMFSGAMAIAMICLLMWGHWPAAEYHTIVVIFGWTLGGFIACMAFVIIGLLVGGPVGRFKGGVTKAGLDFEASGNDQSTMIAAAASGAAQGAVAASNPAGDKP
jgi:hypothetical protein